MVYLAAIGPHELDVPVDLQSPKPAHIAGHAPRTVHSTISMKIGLLPLHRRDGPQPVPSATGTKLAKGAATYTSSDACALH